MSTKELPELMTIDEVAEYLGTGRRYVYRLTHQKRIRFGKAGNQLRFRKSDVAEFVEAMFTDDHERPVDDRPRPGRPRSPHSGPRRR